MEIKVIEEAKNKLIIEIKGQDHTLSNALVKELQNDSDVKITGYNIDHPARSMPKIIVETSKKNPREALAEASERLKKSFEKIKKSVEKEL
jgi:DNA-directed RNA polymerase subunit L